MQSKLIIEEIRQAVIDVKEKGQGMISTDALLNYLNTLEKDAEGHHAFDRKVIEFDIAAFTAENERNIAHYNAEQQHSLEMLRSVIAYGQAALKSAILINGGAAVALLAFIGNIWTKGIVPTAVNSITDAIVFFSLGVLAAAFGTGTTYLTQYCYNEAWDRTAKVFHVFSIVVVFISYILFAKGAHQSYLSFVKHLAS